MARAKGELVSISSVVERYLSQRHTHPNRRHEAHALRVFQAFKSIGGPVCAHAQPVFYRNGVLTLKVDDSPWLTEMGFLKGEIITRLTEILGYSLVRDIRIRLGRPKLPAPVAPPPRPLSPSEQRALDTAATLIDDDLVQNAVLRAMRASLLTHNP